MLQLEGSLTSPEHREIHVSMVPVTVILKLSSKVRERGRDLREGGQVWEVKRVGERKEEKGREGRVDGKERGREKNVLDCAHFRFSAHPHMHTTHTLTHTRHTCKHIHRAITMGYSIVLST